MFYRFKQLKEQEARRRKQKEEEERKTNVVAENNDSVPNGKVTAGTYSVKSEDTKTEPLDTDNSSSTSISSTNGNSSPQDLKECQDISTRITEDDESSSKGKDDQHMYENLKKVRHYSISNEIQFCQIYYLIQLRPLSNTCGPGRVCCLTWYKLSPLSNTLWFRKIWLLNMLLELGLERGLGFVSCRI